MASNRLILLLCAGLLLTGALFWAVPALDMTVAGWFYTAGKGFPMGEAALADGVRRAIWGASIAMVLLGLVFGALALWRKPRVVPGRIWGFILLLYALGPGLVVEWGLKGHWGRARPYDLTAFGGDLGFTPVWQLSDQCHKNCSFSGGEAAGATVLAISLLLVLRFLPLSQIQRRLGVALAVAVPLLASLQRLAAGAHFLSDVVTSVLLVGLLAALLSRVLPLDPPGTAQTGRR